MHARRGGLLSAILNLLTPNRPSARKPRPSASPSPRPTFRDEALRPKANSTAAPSARRDPRDVPTAGQFGDTATVEVQPPSANGLTITYAPSKDDDPDAGEVIWTWVPYDEADGRGKDRPVLVIARKDVDRVYVVRLTSKSHDGDRDFLPIGSGAWDPQGRPSWVDVEQVYVVHRDGMRREAAALDLDRFTAVASVLQRRYGWAVGN